MTLAKLRRLPPLKAVFCFLRKVEVEEEPSFNKAQRQTINPLVDKINSETEPILKVAAEEFGYVIPLAFRLYNQIRFYEEYGKLHLGVSVASKETLAEQFGVTPKQVELAFNNLTNKYKLGLWIEHDKPVFRNVKRTWVSKIRYEKGMSNYYSVIPELLQRNSKTITAEYLPTDKRPLSESKKKVRESKNTTNVVLAKANYGNKSINDIFEYWQEATGLPISSRIKQNRNACNNLLKKYGDDKLRQLIKGVGVAQSDKYAPRISDFVSLQSKLNDLLLWGKQRTNNGKVVKI